MGCRHPENADIQDVTFTQFAMPFAGPGTLSRNAVIVAPGRVDRSPCGTGTCARLAALHARGALAPGQSFVHDGTMRSHVDDLSEGDRIFSRDCPEYEIALPSGQTLLVLVNHLKSKGFATPAVSNARRRLQAEQARKIYNARRQAGIANIAVIGDFNDTPDSDPLAPLLGAGSDLRDIFVHENFEGDGRPGTFGNGTASQKIDYILLSPELFGRVTSAGVFRKGVWGGVNGTLFEHYPEMTKAIHAASDHAALFVDLDI